MFNFKRLLATTSVLATLAATSALAETELRMMWYNDGSESEVMQSNIDRLEAKNPDISVVIDVVPYKSIMES